MYVLYCLALLLLVYLAPALALFPRLARSTETAIAVPFVSALLVVALQALLASMGGFSRAVVLPISIGLLVIAVFRLRREVLGRPLDWPKGHLLSLLLTLLAFLPAMAAMGSSPFATHDEIYSWNMWAVQHYLGEPIDFTYTQAPYPQFYARFVAFCYQVLGDIELQLPTRLWLPLFPLLQFVAIAMVGGGRGFAATAKYLALLVVVLYGVKTLPFYDDGLPDAMMGGALVLSVFYLIQFERRPDETRWLLLSAACAIVAGLSKQPALIWTLFAFPMLTGRMVWRGKIPKTALAAAGVVFAVSLFWVLGPGWGFQENAGVLAASQKARGPAEQLAYAVNAYLVRRPLIGLVFVAAAWAVWKGGQCRGVFLLLLLPALLAWLLFGAYSLRLGMHAVALAALVYAANGFPVPFLAGRTLPAPVPALRRIAGWTGVAVFGVANLAYAAHNVGTGMAASGAGFDLYRGGKNTIYRYFGADSERILTGLYDNPDVLLWVPSNYIYGIFLGHTRMIRPAYEKGEGFHKEEILAQIRAARPDYLFDAGTQVAFGPASGLFREIAGKDCPFLFAVYARPPNRYGYVTYRLRKEPGLLEECRLRVEGQG